LHDVVRLLSTAEWVDRLGQRYSQTGSNFMCSPPYTPPESGEDDDHRAWFNAFVQRHQYLFRDKKSSIVQGAQHLYADAATALSHLVKKAPPVVQQSYRAVGSFLKGLFSKDDQAENGPATELTEQDFIPPK
jgi:hypothetical protein